MDSPDLDVLFSSRTRVRIADLVSRRPRTLTELSALTGITVQGVIRHLRVLEKLGFARREPVKDKALDARKVYSVGDWNVRDFSEGTLNIVCVLTDSKRVGETTLPPRDLEAMADEVTILRARVRGQSRRLARAIDDLVTEQKALQMSIEEMGVSKGDELILKTMFDDENLGESERTLLRHFGVRGGRRSIDKAMAKARQVVRR